MSDTAAGVLIDTIHERKPDRRFLEEAQAGMRDWWARQIKVKRGQMHSLSGTLATMANSLPYAIAAQIAYPTRQMMAFAGDGGFTTFSLKSQV